MGYKNRFNPAFSAKVKFNRAPEKRAKAQPTESVKFQLAQRRRKRVPITLPNTEVK